MAICDDETQPFALYYMYKCIYMYVQCSYTSNALPKLSSGEVPHQIIYYSHSIISANLAHARACTHYTVELCI